MRTSSRKHPVHGVHQYPDHLTIVFVTLCTKGRKPWLANARRHDLLKSIWTDADLWQVGRYVIMPDHIHLFAGEKGDVQLDNWVRYWKSQFSKLNAIKEQRWQTDHWDYRIRSESEYEEKWNYVYWNPVRAGLVDEANNWPYSGEIYDLHWNP